MDQSSASSTITLDSFRNDWTTFETRLFELSCNAECDLWTTWAHDMVAVTYASPVSVGDMEFKSECLETTIDCSGLPDISPAPCKDAARRHSFLGAQKHSPPLPEKIEVSWLIHS